MNNLKTTSKKSIDISPKRTSLLEFIKISQGCQFVIPVYQRNYTWTANKEVLKYIEDFRKLLSGKVERHFIGIIMYLETQINFSFREYSIVDGQQRLTTTFLILYAIKSIALEQYNDQQISGMIDMYYLTNQYATDKQKFKLKPLVSDDDVYNKIVNNKILDITDLEKKSNVYKNFIFIKSELDKLIKVHGLHQVMNCLEGLYIVCIPLIDEDNAQQIFESINSTGARLFSSDLIRNYILMNINSETQEYLYTNYWRQLELMFNDAGRIEDFFRFFLATKNYTLSNKKDIYEDFKTWYTENNIDVENTLKEIVRYAKYYYNIYISSEIDTKLVSSIIEFRKNKSAMPAPFLMGIYELYNKTLISYTTFNDILLLINIYLIRRWLAGLDTSSITRLFPPLLKDVIDECNGDYTNIYEITKKYLVNNNRVKSSKMPDDRELRTYLQNANAYVLDCTRTVLDKLEHYNNPAPVDLSKLNIEHLMPQSATPYWYERLIGVERDEYEKYSNLLGNLTLASSLDNSKMQNDTWTYKKSILNQTMHLKINHDLLKLDDWNTDLIIERTNKLIDEIIKIYPYQSAENVSINTYKVHMNSNGIIATGVLYENGTIDILPGSMVADYSDPHPNSASADTLYRDLVNENIILETETHPIFNKIYTFTSVSTAAGFILKGSRNGWEYWQDENNQPINISLRKLIK